MGQPTPYNPTTDFSEEEADGVAGRSTLRTAAVDVEFANLATTIGQILANLSAIQRDDGGLRDGLVEPWSLSAAALELIGSGGFVVRGSWVTATAYVMGDLVRNTTGTYVCIVDHTSGTFATDLAASKWTTLYDSVTYAASGVTFSPTGTIAASNVQAAIAEVALEAVQIAQNLADVNATTARGNLSVFSKAETQSMSSIIAVAGGGVDAITATFTPPFAGWVNGQPMIVELAGANATTTPSFSPDGLTAKTIVAPDGSALGIGEMPGANFRAIFVYDASLDKVLLLNPCYVGAYIDGAGYELVGVGANRLGGSPPHADVPAAATDSDIWGARYNTFTGGAAVITDVADARYKGQFSIVVANAAHTLTDNANIEVMGDADYVCEIGDVMFWYAKTTSTFQVSIMKADGTAVATTPKTGNVPVQVIKWGAMNVNQNTTRYASGVGMDPNATEATVQFLVLEPCTFSDLHASANAAIPASNSQVITLRKNGADTALTATMGAAATSAADTTHSVDCYPGDLISLKLVSSATMTSTIDFNYSAKVTKLGSAVGEGAPLIPLFGVAGGDGSCGEGIGLDTETDQATPLPETYVQFAAVSGTARVARNGVASQAGGFTPSLLGAYFAAADRLTTNTLRSIALRAINQSTTYDKCVMLFTAAASAAAGMAQGQTRWMTGWGVGANISTENEVKIPMPACVLRNLRGDSGSAVSAGNSTIEVFKNGVSTGLIITFGTGSRYAEDVTNSATFAAGDLLSMKVISGAAVGTRFYKASAEVYAS